MNDSSCMEELLLRLDNVLYKGAESDFSGVIPIIAHSESNEYSQIKTVVVAPSALELAELRSKLLT